MLALVFETGAVVFTSKRNLEKHIYNFFKFYLLILYFIYFILDAVQASDMKETLDKIYPTLRLFGHQH